MLPFKYFLPKIKNFLLTDNFVFLVCAVVSYALFHLTFQTTGTELLIGSKAWSDFAAHIPLIRSFSLGKNWPPEYPLFAGEPIRYHFLFYALVGLLERMGMNLGLALNGVSALGLGLLLFMVYRITRLIFGSRLAGWLAIWLALMNSSLSAWVFANNLDLSWWRLTDWPALFHAVVTQTKFASFGPWDGHPVSAFWTLNIFTNQRHLGLSLGLVWWVLWPLLQLYWQPRKTQWTPKKTWGLSFRIAVMGLFPLLHQAGAILTAGMTIMLVAALVLNYRTRERLNRWVLGSYILGLAIMGLVLLQFVPASHTAPVWSPGFLAETKTWWGIMDYWWWNLGLGCVIWLLGLLLPHRGKLLLWLVTPFFMLANLWQFSPDMINNHKFVNFFIEALVIISAGWLAVGWHEVVLLVRLIKSPGESLKKIIALPFAGLTLALVMTVFLGLSVSGMVDLFPILTDHRYIIEDWPTRPVAIWLKAHTAPDATLLTTTYLYHPGSLVGRKLFLDYGYFAWSLGYADRDRRDLLPQLFGSYPNTIAWCAAMQERDIAAVVISPGDGELGPGVNLAQSFMMLQLSPTTQTEDGYSVYLVREYCQ